METLSLSLSQCIYKPYLALPLCLCVYKPQQQLQRLALMIAITIVCLPFFLPSFLPPMGCTFSGLNALYDVVNGGSADVWINETRFRIVRTLGEGGFSSVYLVREQPGGRPGKQITNPSFTNGNQFVSILTASHILSS